MEYITLKNSDLKVSRLCMGGCPMGGHGWGKTDEEELINAVHTAVDQGINFLIQLIPMAWVNQRLRWEKHWETTETKW